MVLIATLALEFFNASGARTPERLRALIDHYAEIRGEMSQEYRDAAYRQAERAATFDRAPDAGEQKP